MIDVRKDTSLTTHLTRRNLFLFVHTKFRIAGGIGAVIPWIPIKAYRPCPNFIDKGGIYERMGQGLDEIAFGADTSFQKK